MLSDRAIVEVRRLDFPEFRDVSSRTGIYDLVPKTKCCGIYVLGFANGDLYAGQAIDVARRFTDHAFNHGDVTHFTYLPVPKTRLDVVERRVIHALDAFERAGQIRLRNRTFTTVPKGQSALDDVVPDDTQRRFLAEPSWNDLGGRRTDDAALRSKTEREFARRAPELDRLGATALLREHVRTAVLAPRRTELSFWSVTLQPAKHLNARLNIYWQEVLTIGNWKGETMASFHVARSPLEEAYGTSLQRFDRLHPDVSTDDHAYDPGGTDQIHLEAATLSAARELLHDEAFVKATRLMNWQLMKKGPNNFARYHSFPLGDLIVPAEVPNTQP